MQFSVGGSCASNYLAALVNANGEAGPTAKRAEADYFTSLPKHGVKGWAAGNIGMADHLGVLVDIAREAEEVAGQWG